MTTTRLSCRFCQTALERSFVDLGVSPLANSYRTREQLGEVEPFYPLHVYVCAQCLLVQLPEAETPKEIFSDYAYFSSYSDTLLEHSRVYAQQARKRFGLDSGSLVVEVASNDGYLLRYFKQAGVPVLGIEPAANVAEAAEQLGIPTRVDFFGSGLADELRREGREADLIIGNNVLAHVPDLNDFVRGFATLLKPQGVATLEFPHLMRLVEHNQFDTIYHEHYSYFSFHTVQRVFAAHGLTLFDVDEIGTHGGSLRIYACRSESGSHSIDARVADLLEAEEQAGITDPAYYERYARRVRRSKREILDFVIRAKNEGKSLVGYGAPAKANTLLNYCGIGTDFIDYTVDRSPHKQDHYLPGTQIPIHAPDKIDQTRPDYVIVLPWNIKEEIMKSMAQVRSWGGKFVVLIPSVQIHE